MKLEYGLLKTEYQAKENSKGELIPSLCGDEKCDRLVSPNEACFFDTTKNLVYCDSCGKCVRYSRKKAVQRGELHF